MAGSPPIEVTHERAELLVGGGCLTGTGLRRSDPAPLS